MKIDYRIEYNPAKNDYRLMINTGTKGWVNRPVKPVMVLDKHGDKEIFVERAKKSLKSLLEEMRPKKDEWEIVEEGMYKI